jgi:hypothetical protein
MKILSSKMYEFYTEYKVKYNNKLYTCNYNGGLPKLNEMRLSEKFRFELSEIIEDYFLNNINNK